MKNYIKPFLYLILLVAVLGCDGEDYLDEADYSSNQLITEFTTNLEIDDLVRGGYFNLGSPNRGSAVTSSVLREIQSDIVDFKTYAGGNIASTDKYSAPIYNREADENNLLLIKNSYRGPYMAIFSANQVLGIIEDTGAFPEEANGQRQIDRMKGECLFLRAYSHYQLATLFALPYSSNPDAPSIVLRTELANGVLDLPARSTSEEVYQQIISDLKKAITLLPESYNAGLNDPDSFLDRANRDAARFLLAKVYFHMGDAFWTSGVNDGGAKEQIDFLIDSGRYPLVVEDALPDGETLSSNIFQQNSLGAAASESVWQVAYYFRNGWRVPEYFWFFAATIADPQNGRVQSRSYSFSNAALEKIGWDDPVFAAQDVRYNSLYVRYEKDDSNGFEVDPNFADSYEQQGNVWAKKFGPNRNAQVPVFRSAELYLMRANISPADAVSDINIIRERASVGPYTPVSSVTDEEIEIEWIKELAFEGKRLFYLQALKKDVGPGDRSGDAVPYDDASLVRLFPAEEIARNPALSN